MKTTYYIKLLMVLIFTIPQFANSQVIILSENFSAETLPTGWTNIDNANTGDKWAFNDPDNRSVTAGNFSGGFAILDSDYYGSGSSQNSELNTSAFNTSIYETVTLDFDYQYRDYDSGESCKVQVYNGATWTTLLTYNLGDENYSGASHVSIDITSATGGSTNAKVRFLYVGTYDWWFALDNVEITGIEPAVLVSNPNGPGGIGTADGNSGLKLWLDANTVSATDNATVTTWPDKSGNGHNFTDGNGATYVASSQNGYPSFSFNGSSKYFERPFTAALTPNSFTVFSTNQVTASSTYKCIISNRDDPSGTATRGFILYAAPNSNQWQFWTGNTSISWNTNPVISSTAGSWAGVMFQFNGSNNDKLINSNVSSDVTGNSLITKNTSKPIRIGAGRNESTPNYFFKGNMGEVIMFDELLTDVEKTIINNYLSAKYNYNLGANDYYAQDNSGSGNFDHNVAGIGKASDGSSHTNSKGTGIIQINTPSNLDSDEYLFWGENAKDATYEFSTNTTDYQDRLNSTWRVSKRNNLGNVSLSVAAADLNLTNKQSCAPLKLVVSSIANFSTKTTYDLTLEEGIYTAINVDFTDGDYFTYEYQDVIAVDNSSFYNGSGAHGKPNTDDACYKLLVKSSATGALTITENANVREVEIETGGLITLTSGNALIITGNINNQGTFTLEENASLIQNTTGVNTNSGNGDYRVKRSGNNSSYIYNIWSSPIKNANITSVFSGANPCDIWVFDRLSQAWSHDYAIGYSTSCYGNAVTFTASDVISGGDGLMDVTGGYFVPGNATSTKTYTGEVNNGDYSKVISITSLGNPGGNDWGDDDWNLLGNPYPSALSAGAFWTENALNNNRITDALYFWDEADTTGGYNQNSDYASWNFTGGVNSGNSDEIPSGNIASGQGFWVVAKTNSSVIFNNAMRTSSNSQFFKQDSQTEKHNAWFSFSSPSGYQNNILVGFNSATTDQEDPGFDAHKLVGNAHVRFASYIGTDEFVIQSVAPIAIGSSKTIPLVVTSDEHGMHTFSGYKRENMPSNLKIYLRDKRLNIDTDLETGDYTITLDANVEYASRFELVFKSEITSAGNGSSPKGDLAGADTTTTVTGINETIKSNFTFIQNENEIVISNQEGINGSILIFDVTGKLIWEKENVKNQVSQTINIGTIPGGTYFITILSNGEKVFTYNWVKP
jgi:hypothetical protein